jgi:hypothetical protein
MRKEFLTKIVGIALIVCGVVLLAKIGIDTLNNVLTIPSSFSAGSMSGSETLTMPTIDTFFPKTVLLVGFMGGLLLIIGGITYLYYPIRSAMETVSGVFRNGINFDDLLNGTPPTCENCTNYEVNHIPRNATPFPKEKVITVVPKKVFAPAEPTRYRPHRRVRK